MLPYCPNIIGKLETHIIDLNIYVFIFKMYILHI